MVKYTLLERVFLVLHRLQRRSFERKIASIPSFGYDGGKQELERRVSNLLGKHGTVIVSLAGESGAGKTTLGRWLAERFGGRVLKIDDYLLRGITDSTEWDRPRGHDLELLKSHLRQLKRGFGIQKPVYAMSQKKRTGYEPFPAARLVVLDGIHALHWRLFGHAQLRVYVETEAEKRLMRTVERWINEYKLDPALAAPHQKELVEPLARIHIMPTKRRAHLIIRT